MRADGRTARRAGTRQQIFDAAIALFAERGFSTTSVDDIAERAGIAKGSIYYHFGSKDQLFREMLDEGMRAVTARLREAADSAPPGWPAVQATVAGLLGQIRDHRDLAKLFAAEVFRTDRPWRETMGALRGEMLGVLGDAIDTARRTGSVPADLDPRLAAAAVFGSVLMTGLEWLTFQPELPFETVLATLLRTLRGALGDA